MTLEEEAPDRGRAVRFGRSTNLEKSAKRLASWKLALRLLQGIQIFSLKLVEHFAVGSEMSQMSKTELYECFLNGARKEITEEQYTQLKSASANLQVLWKVEEVFSVLAKSFLDIEEYLAATAMRYRFAHDNELDERDWLHVRASLNLKILSFITASRVYLDQMGILLSKLSTANERKIDFLAFTHDAYDKWLEYRVMYALRNYVIHNDLPLGGVHYSYSNKYRENEVSDSSPSRGRMTIDPVFKIDAIVSWKKLKSELREEICGLEVENLDVKFFVRGFVAALCQIHGKVREETEDTFFESMGILRSARDGFSTELGKDVRFLEVCRKSDGKITSSTIVDIGHFEAVNYMRRLWKALGNAQRLYMSTEIVLQRGKFPTDHQKIWIDK